MLTAARWFGALMLLGTAWTVLGLPALGMVLAARSAPAFTLSAPMTLREAGARQVAGRCWREQVGQLIHVHLEGRSEDFGYAEGLLVGDRVALIERDMMAMFVERVPSFVGRHLILGFVNLMNANLDSHFTDDELREISAITSGHHELHDPYLAVSPSYARGLQYHALHDISQYLIDAPFVHPPQIGCTAVAVTGSRSVDGHLLVGRLFDFEGGRRFDQDKIVYTVAPDGGHRFVSVSWGGMAGAVTGLNDAGIWVSLNAAATGRLRFSGRPIVMVVRVILERCATLDQAVEVVRRAGVFVSDGVLIGSGREGRAVVAEKGPDGFAVREMDHDRLVLTNHFLADAWKGDATNAKRVSDGTTAIRFARAEELLAERERHDPASILALCRDHRGAHDIDVGFGNRSTINAWIGAHLVVADVSAGIIWVCEPWHGLGRALAFDVNGPRPDIQALPADPELAFEEEHGEEYRRLVEDCNAQLVSGQRAAAARTAAHLLALNPNAFEANALAGQASDNPAKRRELLERARSLQPAYLADRQRIDKLLAESAPR